MNLFDMIASTEGLKNGFAQAANNNGAPGADGQSVQAFAAQGTCAIEQLSQSLFDGTYYPRPARQVLLAKSNGSTRPIVIACVRDRIVQHSIAQVLSKTFDHMLHPSAYAFRQNRSATQAVEVVERAFRSGREWVFRGDISSFFDSITQERVLTSLKQLTDETRLLELIALILRTGILDGGDITDIAIGTYQGSALSPFLSNLYLAPFDEAIEQHGFSLVRFGDDMCINTENSVDAHSAMHIVEHELHSLALVLNREKANVRELAQGVPFLGWEFTRNGRQPGPRAVDSLLAKIRETYDSRPKDHDEEILRIMRGWFNYYRSFSLVELPSYAKPIAERIEHHAVEKKHLHVLQSTIASGQSTSLVHIPSALSSSAREFNRWDSFAAALETRNDVQLVALRNAFKIEQDEDWLMLCDAVASRDAECVAEVLASLQRYDDAQSVIASWGDTERSTPHAFERKEFREHEREPSPDEKVPLIETSFKAPSEADIARMIELFDGSETACRRSTFDAKENKHETIQGPLTDSLVDGHLLGKFRMGVYPIRADGTVRFMCVRFFIKSKVNPMPALLIEKCKTQARMLIDGLKFRGIMPLISVEPMRGYVVWICFERDLPLQTARKVVERLVMESIPTNVRDESVYIFIEPDGGKMRGDNTLWCVYLPLGVHLDTSQRALFLREDFTPVEDQFARMRAHRKVPMVTIASMIEAIENEMMMAQRNVTPSMADGDEMLFTDHPRAKLVYLGCGVFRHCVHRAVRGHGLLNTERFFIADMLGRLGEEGKAALEIVLRHLADYRRGMAAKMLPKSNIGPTGCKRIQERWPTLAEKFCSCRFSIPRGAYPTPTLHAIGASEITGVGERVRKIAAQGAIAKEALDSMSQGRKVLGERASALFQRLVQLRQQKRDIEDRIRESEEDLSKLMEEAGTDTVETPRGVLRRVLSDGQYRFVLEC